MPKKTSNKTRLKRYASRHAMRLAWRINRVNAWRRSMPLEPINPPAVKLKKARKPHKDRM